MSLRDRVAGTAGRLTAMLRRTAKPGRRLASPRQTEDPALFRPLIYGDPDRLHVAATAVVNNALFNLSSGEITVGEYAFFGHNVSVFTGTHDWTTFGAQRQVAVPKSGRDVVIEEGVWVSSNAIVVAPCRIGAHAVVGVGSVVLRDVEPYTVVAGNPARVLRTIPRPGEAADSRGSTPTGAKAALQEPVGLARELAEISQRVTGLEREIAELRAKADGGGQRFAGLYAGFTERFRGSTAEVTEKLAGYLPDVRRVVGADGPVTGEAGTAVVDVGSGRGEWLALLADAGVSASGVDANPAFVEEGRSRGLNLVHGDAVAHLQGLAPGSVDLITAFHVIEHLDVETLLALLAASRQALRPGGCLLLETPNPTNLRMAACDFYNDPTHRSPLPPALTEYLVSACGFEEVEVRPLHPDRPPADPAGAGSLVEQLMAGMLFGPQDYAVLGYRPRQARQA
ncbi:MAG: methyltransferase domain-containing protein [Pseudonocardiales bacterium]